MYERGLQNTINMQVESQPTYKFANIFVTLKKEEFLFSSWLCDSKMKLLDPLLGALLYALSWATPLLGIGASSFPSHAFYPKFYSRHFYC